MLRQIGAGGMGAVYLGRDPELDRQVAIKVIREEVHDQEVLDRFFREARAAAALRHPNIITIYASGQHEHQPYMVMEFVDGESLADIIRRQRSLTLAVKMSYLEQICAGLHFAHRAGIVHRDVKPANVMVDKDGTVRILDFGIARIEGSAMTQDGALMGSLNYMSPEQMLGRPVDHRSDVFSVGSLAYELLCYQQAFKGGLNDGLLHRLPHEDPPPLCDLYPGLPPALEQVIVRALQKAPEHRFQDLAEMRSALVGAPHQEEQVDNDQQTIVIARPGAPRADSVVIPVAPPSALSATPTPLPAATPDVPPSATSAGVAEGSQRFGEPVRSTPPPGTPVWQVKKKPGTPPMSLPAKSTAQAAKPPAIAKPQPPPARGASSRTWVIVGVAAAALVGGTVAAIPWLTAPPPSALERERPAIEAVMERYRIGYQNRDLTAVAAVFPDMPRNTRLGMQRLFNDCLVYEVRFDRMQIELAPTDDSVAQFDVSSTHTCTPQSGGRQTTSTEHEIFTLRKSGDRWLINSATRSAGGNSTNRAQ